MILQTFFFIGNPIVPMWYLNLVGPNPTDPIVPWPYIVYKVIFYLIQNITSSVVALVIGHDSINSIK